METKRNVMRKSIRPRVVVSVLSGTFALAALIECGAYELGVRAEARATARQNLPANYCVKCHSDAKTVRMMILKEDNNGTASYCAGVKLPSRGDLAKDEASIIAPHHKDPHQQYPAGKRVW